MDNNIKIFETAFVTADFRALNIALSKDSYAYLWPTKKTKKYRTEYVRGVSQYEPLAHCLRNRFFFDQIKRLSNNGEIEMLINFGCGFSMYPFLLPENLEHIEIDMPDCIDFKKEKIKTWQSQGILPERKVHFIAADFNTNYKEELMDKLLSFKKDKNAFILIEGVLFFISRSDTNKLFGFFSEIQKKGEYVGSVSFQKQIEQKIAFKRLEKFTKARLDFNEKFCYQTIEDNYYENLSDYNLIDHENTFTLNQRYVGKKMKPDEVLDEHIYILKKTNGI